MSTVKLRCELHRNGRLMQHVGEVDGVRVVVQQHEQAALRANGAWFIEIASLESAISRILSCSAQFHTLAEAREFASNVIAEAGPNPTHVELVAAFERVQCGPDAIVDEDLDDVAAGPIVVVPCGAQKRETAAPADQLYTSQHFRLTYRAACKVAEDQDARVFILSALHGLVEPSAVLEPYDIKMGDAGSIKPPAIAEQLAAINATTITTLLPRAYRQALEAAGADVVDLYASAPGIGYQRAIASRIVAAA